MKTLIADDDFTSRLLLQEILKKYGPVHIAVNGHETVQAFKSALESGEPYNLICLDIMMPEVDGYDALKKIRDLEHKKGIAYASGTRVIMATALDQVSDVSRAFQGLCDAYLCKPIDKAKLVGHLSDFRLI